MTLVQSPSPCSANHRSLALRVERLEQVIAALEERVHAGAAFGPVPAPLGLAIRDFRIELGDVRERLRVLTPS